MNNRLSLADDQQQLGCLLGAVVFVAAPHAFNLAPMVMAYFGLLALWHFAALYLKFRLPDKSILLLLTVAGAGIVLWHYHRFWGQQAGSSLFIVGLGLKLLETKTQRDAYLVVFLAFFVALTQYLFSQSIPMAAYTLVAVILLIAAMIGLNSNAAFPLKARLGLSVAMVSQAVPLMIFLFIFFPRIQGPLWELPDDSQTAKSGLGDTLSPGSLNRLALSQETAFRVEFEGSLPPAKLRYWRGPVFWRTNGEKWTLLPTSPLLSNHQVKFGGGIYNYRVTLEPHHQRWVFALDLPDSIPDEFIKTSDYQIVAKEDITERKQYRVSSRTVYTTGPLSNGEMKRALQLPPNTSERMKELVKGWQQEAATDKALAERALRFFSEEAFYYTLNPPLLNGNPVDKFLFETRRGFCEHFATSFVILMRIAGIPARVVTGYQGGQWNSVGGFLEVKQADAHAWAEVWLAESGWTRFDPTAAVAPERIDRGVDVESQVAFGEISFNLADGFAANQGFRLINLWRKAGMIAASIDYEWDSWVIAYGTENQLRFFQWLGLIHWGDIAVWLSTGLIVSGLVLAKFILPIKQTHDDPAIAIYRVFLAKLAAHGFNPQKGEGPVNFARRVGRAIPDLAESITIITQLYVRLRYEPCHTVKDLEAFRNLVKHLPKPRTHKGTSKIRLRSWFDKLTMNVTD